MSEQNPNNPINKEEIIDVRHYLYLIWHWLWLILLAAVIAGAATYFFNRQMTPIYEVSTKLLVMEAPSSKNVDYNSVLASQSLTKTYSDMLTNDLILQEVINRVNLANDIPLLKKAIKVAPVTNTQLIEISVEDPDPVLAARIANTLVAVFIEKVESIQSSRFSSSKDSLGTQLQEMGKQLADINQKKALATNEADRDNLNSQALQYQQLYSNLLTSYEQARLAEIQSSANVTQVNAAMPNTVPVSPKILQNTIIAALVGLFLAMGIIFGLDALDDTIKTPEEVTSKLGMPVLGVIFEHKVQNEPITMASPRSPISEAFRSLRTNIIYANVDNPIHTLLVTSASPGEGKTTVSANLAIVFANSGKQVYFADADMRQPTVHKKMDIPNSLGLSQLVMNPETPLNAVSQNGKVRGLNVITCGDLPPNPAELLGSKKMEMVVERLKKDADLVIFDTPPVLAVSDPAVLAPCVDGVVLVLRPGKTTMHAARQALEQLNQVNARVVGAVLNDVRTNGHSYGYYYSKGYYSKKYYGKEGKTIVRK